MLGRLPPQGHLSRFGGFAPFARQLSPPAGPPQSTSGNLRWYARWLLVISHTSLPATTFQGVIGETGRRVKGRLEGLGCASGERVANQKHPQHTSRWVRTPSREHTARPAWFLPKSLVHMHLLSYPARQI